MYLLNEGYFAKVTGVAFENKMRPKNAVVWGHEGGDCFAIWVPHLSTCIRHRWALNDGWQAAKVRMWVHLLLARFLLPPTN